MPFWYVFNYLSFASARSMEPSIGALLPKIQMIVTMSNILEFWVIGLYILGLLALVTRGENTLSVS